MQTEENKTIYIKSNNKFENINFRNVEFVCTDSVAAQFIKCTFYKCDGRLAGGFLRTINFTNCAFSDCDYLVILHARFNICVIRELSKISNAYISKSFISQPTIKNLYKVIIEQSSE